MSKKRRLTARQVRYLWAVGAFRRKGGTKRGVTYDRAAAQRARPAIGGSKAAGLRSGTGGRAKPDHSATRAARIAAGQRRLEQFAGRQAAAYKARLSPSGSEKIARGGERLADGGRAGKKQRIFIDQNGDARSRPVRPGLVGRYGRKGAGDYATEGRSVNRADAVQRAAARAVAVSAAKQRGRAYINATQRKGLDASPAARRSLTASEFKAALRETGAKALPSPRQVKVAGSRQKLAAALRRYRAESPALAREKLLKLKTEPQYKPNLRNPFRARRKD